MARRALEVQAAAVLELQRRKQAKPTVFGLVDPEKGLIKTITNRGSWREIDEKPDIYLAAKMERVLTSTKRFIVLLGGRGSTKSVGVADICIAEAKDHKSKTYFLREFQSSIKNSVHSLIKAEIERFGFNKFDVLQQSIGYDGEEAFEFAGLSRNIDSVKSTHGFRRFVVEESQFISQASLDALTPTIREKPNKGLPLKFQPKELKDLQGDIESHPDKENVSIVFIANPGSSTDPFSKRFIEPFKTELDRDGCYEDDLHLIITINYLDNPWHYDSGLETERLWDWENRERAYYDHRWLGHYNDSVDDSIIKPEWFDAAIDAHLKLGFKPRGEKVLTHDPSDTGDAKAYMIRHGSVVLEAEENTALDVNDGCDWALDKAIDEQVDVFRYDSGGLGLTLRRQVSESLKGKRIDWQPFNGAETCRNPKSVYEPVDEPSTGKDKRNMDVFKNLRAQCYRLLADRFYRTWRAVTKDEYIDPDQLISISSEIKILPKLRSELCRIPKKPNGNNLFQIMDKHEMKTKLKIDSPNLADCAMMSMDQPKAKKSDFLQDIPINTKYIV